MRCHIPCLHNRWLPAHTRAVYQAAAAAAAGHTLGANHATPAAHPPSTLIYHIFFVFVKQIVMTSLVVLNTICVLPADPGFAHHDLHAWLQGAAVLPP